MIEDSTEEFLMVVSGEGSFGHPSPRWHSTSALLIPTTTTPSLKDILDIATAQQVRAPFSVWLRPPS
jgi:isopentenyl phosphate kinase